MNYLAICEIISIDQHLHSFKSNGHINPKKYAQQKPVNPLILVLEGINQFAVKSVKMVYPELQSSRVVPIQWKEFNLTSPSINALLTYLIEGEISSHKPFYQITFTLQTADPQNTSASRNKHNTIASGTVLVSALENHINYSRAKSVSTDTSVIQHPKKYADILSFDISSTNERRTNCLAEVSVAIYAKAKLFAEHFPGLPLLPGAFSIYLCIDVINEYLTINFTKNYFLKKVIKLNLVVPIEVSSDINCFVVIRSLQEKENTIIARTDIINMEDKRLVEGIFLLAPSTP